MLIGLGGPLYRLFSRSIGVIHPRGAREGSKLRLDHVMADGVAGQFADGVQIQLVHDVGAVRSAVLTLMFSAVATSLLLLPSARSCATSRSRDERRRRF